MSAARRTLHGECLVSGSAAGDVLFSDVPLSFMGGTDPLTGVITDTHHPLVGTVVTGKVFAIPSGRGSCAGSGAIFEMLAAGTAPAALIFEHKESIVTVGVVIARELLHRDIPVVRLAPSDFEQLRSASEVSIVDGTITLDDDEIPASVTSPGPQDAGFDPAGVALTDQDRAFLAGDFGEAARVAMRTVISAAQLEGATELIDVELAHIDGCFYQGPASLEFATTLRDLGARVRVPSSMNSVCVDRRRWQGQGVPASLGVPSDQVADAYEAMGVTPTYTCAPYGLTRRPEFGQQIAWAESNAVVYANSVLGARTMKYPDYLDIMMAIVGRAPNVDCHRDEGRRPTVRIDVEPLDDLDDTLFPVLGYHVGKIAPNDIPVVCGLEGEDVSADDLKAFGAAFATTSAAPMFHVVGATPEAETLEALLGEESSSLRRLSVTKADLARTWRGLNTATSTEVDLVSLGNPHLTLTEMARLADLLDERTEKPQVPLMITCGREVHERASAAGYVERIERFGASFINDTCWCLIQEPIIPVTAQTIVTNSAKYAHYGPAAIHRSLHLRSVVECVDAACTGRAPSDPPRWLAP